MGDEDNFQKLLGQLTWLFLGGKETLFKARFKEKEDKTKEMIAQDGPVTSTCIPVYHV